MFPAVDLYEFFKSSLALYLIIVIRYFGIAGFFYWLVWKRKNNFTRLQKANPEKSVMKKEIFWSVVTSIIFALPGAYMIEAWKLGATQIYVDPMEYGWAYLGFSALVYLLIHDTYFYWTHRWLHRPKIYKTFHKVHHQSLNPTPWAAFSFHPYEGVIEAIILPLLTFVIPIHAGVLLFILTAMTFFSVVNHAGYEIYPKAWMSSWWGRWMISPTHHNKHHKEFNCNYGLYFQFWDILMGTNKFPVTKKGLPLSNRAQASQS